MAKGDRTARVANQVSAFVQEISQDERALETLVGWAAERGHEIDVGALRRYLELSAGFAVAELTDAELEPVAGGLGGDTLTYRLGARHFGVPSAHPGVPDPIESNIAPMKHAASDRNIGPKKSKMKPG